jgi:DNA-binding transcriptional MerR regulator
MRARMIDDGLPIGAASRRSGVKVPTIRYYEQIGLLPKTARKGNNRRFYGADDVRRLVFIRRARELGFEVDAIRALLALQDDPDQSCVAADGIARARLDEIERRIERLLSLKSELERMISDCSRGRVAECRVIEVLASDNSTSER